MPKFRAGDRVIVTRPVGMTGEKVDHWIGSDAVVVRTYDSHDWVTLKRDGDPEESLFPPEALKRDTRPTTDDPNTEGSPSVGDLVTIMERPKRSSEYVGHLADVLTVNGITGRAQIKVHGVTVAEWYPLSCLKRIDYRLGDLVHITRGIYRDEEGRVVRMSANGRIEIEQESGGLICPNAKNVELVTKIDMPAEPKKTRPTAGLEDPPRDVPIRDESATAVKEIARTRSERTVKKVKEFWGFKFRTPDGQEYVIPTPDVPQGFELMKTKPRDLSSHWPPRTIGSETTEERIVVRTYGGSETFGIHAGNQRCWLKDMKDVLLRGRAQLVERWLWTATYNVKPKEPDPFELLRKLW